LLQKFSKLVRLVLENSQHPKIALNLELEALELYLQLEAIRLDDRFTYRIDIDPELEKHPCYLPPMILQPFAENAILHGLRHLRDRQGLLTVRLRTEPAADGKKYLHCTIEDNGIGRAQAAEINARTRISGKKQSLGSRLTTQRVELLNTPGNQDYTVEITDLSGTNTTGTLVTIRLPLVYTDRENRNDLNDAMPIHT
jgi:LytS/YehU family sensor histidine kinase